MSHQTLQPLPEAMFRSAVQVLPLVSVDWELVDPQGWVLTAWRQNAPARLSWFTPEGRLRKGEHWQAALLRVVLPVPDVAGAAMSAYRSLHAAWRCG